MKRNLVLILLACLWMTARSQTMSPTVVTTSGGFFANSNGSLSWTIGEPVTETVTNGTNILTQGFQQPDILITSVAPPDTAVQFSVYPNPSSDVIHLSFQQPIQGTILVELFSIDGQLVYSELTVADGTDDLITINVANLATGVYMMKVTTPGNTVPSIFKVQKTN